LGVDIGPKNSGEHEESRDLAKEEEQKRASCEGIHEVWPEPGAVAASRDGNTCCPQELADWQPVNA
jgi:hypothetical protein